MPIPDRGGLAGIIDEQLVTGNMILAQYPFLARLPPPVLIAGCAALPAIRMSRFVLLPQQQRSGNSATLQLSVQTVKIRLRCEQRAAVELRAQRRLVKLTRQRPGPRPACGAGTSARPSARCDAHRDLSAVVPIGRETQDIAYLAHG